VSHSHEILIAIDGPSASGKSTVSRKVAEELNFTYVDSGSFYRGFAWKAWKAGVSAKELPQVRDLLEHIRMEFFVDHRAVRFTIDGEDPYQELRSKPVVERVSDFAAIPEVRAYMVLMLQSMASFGQVVMEGRDIGTVVFTDTPFKFYLDADPHVRAKRRHREQENNDDVGNFNEVLKSLRRRDDKDTTRKMAPLQIAENAKVINTTSMSIDDVVQQIICKIKTAGFVP